MLNKWLWIPVTVLFFGFVNKHPLHLSTVEVNHNADDKTLEISCRIFTDDFETILGRNYKTKTNFYDGRQKVKMDSLVKKYIQSHLQIKADDKLVALNYLGFEKENEAVYAYVEGMNVPKLKKISITNSIMHDMFTDQVNILHIIVDGDRKSTKLDYPKTSAVFDF